MKSRARTAEDVEKAYRKGIAEGERNAALFCVYVCLLFLADKAGWREVRLQRFIDFFGKYTEMLAKKEIGLTDIRRIMKDEYDIEVNWQ